MTDVADWASDFSQENLCLIAKGTLENLPYVAHIVSVPDYRLVFVNQALIDLFKTFDITVSQQDLGKHPWEVFPNWREVYMPLYEEVRVTGRATSRKDVKHALDGRMTYWDVAFVPGFDESGEVNSIASVRMDNTDRRLAEEAQARLAAIVESSSDAIIGKTLDGIITSWNKGAEQIYGYSAAEAVGQPISMLVPPGNPDEIPRIMERLRRGEHIDHYETDRVTKDGEILCVSLSISPIVDAVGNIVGAATIARDITDVKESQRERERLVWYLQARSNQLRCLYQVSSLTQMLDLGVGELLTRAVALLPAAWQFPEVCAARIRYGGEEYATPNFAETQWMQSADLSVDGQLVGDVTVSYLEERPPADEGPFLKEERFLIDTVGRNLGSALERSLAQQRENEVEHHKREFYCRTILAATEGKLEITDAEEIQRLAKQPMGVWNIERGEDVGNTRLAATQLAESYGMEEQKLDDFVLCIGEAITNAYKHANGGSAALYWLADAVLFVVADRGTGISALALPELALKKGYTTAVSLGMGYKMMISLADKVYLATGPGGTTVAIEVKLHPQPKVSTARLLAEAWSF